jgi:hypothetical protein
MLAYVAAREQDAVLARWHSGPARRTLLRNFLQRYEEGTPRPRLHVDDLQHPRLLVGTHGARLTVQGPRPLVRHFLRQLAAGPRGAVPGWPDKYTREVWAKGEWGGPYVRLVQVYWSYLDEAERAGLVRQAEGDGHAPHFLYWITGRPRFAALVRHACRLGAGQELHARLVSGIPYDETGEYTRECLEHGPSFVCEIAPAPRRARGTAGTTPAPAVPVCWSCTHLGGSMGMIYTPEQHRGHGYATSLGAFQVDHMLASSGLAWAQVRWNNLPSQRIMEKFGARRTREALTRGIFCWR